MKSEVLWQQFCRNCGVDVQTPHEAWQFGAAPDKLAELVKSGIKTATASAYELYALDDEPLPQSGDYSVILDSRDAAVCVIRTERVTVVPFCEVSPEHARKEGEGDLSLVYWRRVHEEFFIGELAEAGLPFREDMPVVCEEFSLCFVPLPPVIETERLRLRQYEAADREDLAAVISDAETMQFYERPYDEAGVQRWLSWNFDNYENLGFGLWAMEEKESGEMIGDCGITMQIIDHKIVPEIGYHVRKDRWNCGLGTEAARACRDWAFAHTPFQTLYSYMNAANIGSYTVAEKNGMHFVKEYEDDGERLKVYAITRTEWAAGQETDHAENH